MSEAGKLWKVFKILCDTLDREGVERNFCGLSIGLRLLAHPALKPYCEDPLLTLDGELPSLDALTLAFQQKLAQVVPAATEVGGIWGALYLPAEGRAATLRLRAFVCAGAPELLVLRSLAPELALSVHAALRAARAQVEREDGFVLLDIESEGLDDSQLGSAVGDSLGLPLALVFVSAFQRRALPVDLGATGSIGRSGPDRIDPVGWVDKKREILAERGIQLLAPPEIGTLRQAWELITAEPSLVRGELEEPLTPLLGREREILRLTSLLSQPEIRLVTVTGPGGVGKTRLALHSLRALSHRYPGGVWTLSLADKTAGGEIKELFANVLGISVGELLHRLAGRPTLLLLDNAETEPKAAEKIRELLRSFPDLVCLVTSRTALGVRGEHRFDLEGLSREEGVLLFSQRAKAACDTYSEDPILVAEIVRQLDGLPLAIELAASRVRMLSLAELAARLNRALSLLSTRSQDVPERHRTIRATLEWSYQFLDSYERHVLETLSVFAEGFSEFAAIAVTGDEEVFNTLVRLEEHSLLHHKEGRYRLLSLVREFAYEYLVSHGREALVSDAHAAYYANFLQEQRREALRIGQADPVRVLTQELGNLRATFTWLKKSPDFRLLRFVADVSTFLEIRGLEREREIWIRAALPLLSEDTALEISTLILLPLVGIARRHKNIEQAEKIVEDLIQRTRVEPSSAWHAGALAERSAIKAVRQEWQSALSDSEEAFQIHQNCGNILGQMQTLNKRGLVRQWAGDLVGARRDFEAALLLGDSPMMLRERVLVLDNLLELDIEAKEIVGALRRARQQYLLNQTLRDLRGMTTTFWHFGRILLLVGALSEARLVLFAARSLRQYHWRTDLTEIESILAELGEGSEKSFPFFSEDEWLTWEPPLPDSLRQVLGE